MKGHKLPPWSRHHEPWCAIFRGKPVTVTTIVRRSGDGGRYPAAAQRRLCVKKNESWKKPNSPRNSDISC